MQSYFKAALAGLILLTGYTPTTSQDVHHIYFNFPQVNKRCLNRGLDVYFQGRKDVIEMATLLDNTPGEYSRLTEIFIEPKITGQKDENGIREIVKRCQMKKEN